MTAEIVVMNKSAVAIAADSAVTIQAYNSATGRQEEKVYNTANKVFTLSKHRPIGIMVYNSMELCGIPWETVIKEYRSHLGAEEFDTVEGYTEHFIKYLCSNRDMFTADQQEAVLIRILLKIYSSFIINGTGNQQISSNSQAKKKIDSVIKSLEKEENSIGFNDSDIDKYVKKYKAILDDTSSAIFNFNKIGISNLAVRLRRYGVLRLVKPTKLDGFTGVVFTGFGQKEYFPSLSSFNIDGIFDNRVIISRDKTFDVSEEQPSNIIPFAQTGMAEGLMLGASSAHSNQTLFQFYQLFKDLPTELVSRIVELDEVQKRQYIEDFESPYHTIFGEYMSKMSELAKDRMRPIKRAISVMPISELGAIAEIFVNLAQLEHRLSLEAETVGGPVDVAVISKGDGFVWIKRKHYFDKDLNPGFVANYLDKLYTKNSQGGRKKDL